MAMTTTCCLLTLNTRATVLEVAGGWVGEWILVAATSVTKPNA